MKFLKKVMIFSIGLVISSSPSVAKEINKIEKNIRVIKYPISSNFYSECRENKSEKECKKISDIKDYSYKSTKILKELPVEGRFLSDGKIKDLNVDNFRFISKGNDIVYSIAEKYVDTDEEAKSEFYLIKIKPKLEIEKIGYYYSIDSSGIISYKDEYEKLLKKNLK
ncbi:hypothetical protein NVT87_13945 [Acinetobacter radioresistens]|jgi:hypothetical protein|uniref:Uncharacterized protein n=1 Tax=Acinetobacter radioresistens SK82 TaxID=596318 RepID=A0ABP2GIH8_ACIRA|nr:MULTISPECIES: hypothetical protein [Acinetobacter]HCQ91612.1 hypothetical protein [Clostridium sp.]EET81471.1 hypothetical protein ACIRA0001_0501 [Acinetobacter radioresistens SK82]ENV86218.1 hypothetical protein F940_01530 [Acinetobacter radioresistens NIPH 2130]ENV89820.1 hypothetical protein F939_00499 [Acinetobacter radioresistens DSM 6976 = NBRC 102413 = CIP 103788]EXB75763.1 hypothetical protein J538_3390 [Acinetobacter sp. 272263]